MATRVLAFDFGASSGRAVLATYADGLIALEEVHRFSNDPVEVRGTLYWDILRLYHEIKQGVLAAGQRGGFDAIGIDTWGVDFGLLDAKGRLLQNPVHYRDKRTAGAMERVFARVPADTIYRRTGIQFMHFNTLYQLAVLAEQEPDLLRRAETMLLIPDLFAYFLTGAARAEYTNATTTQMIDAAGGVWAADLLDTLGVPARLLPPLIEPGQTYGTLSPELCEELGCDPVPVIAVATHDTASAIAAVPTRRSDFLYISCGTWSLFGTEIARPLIDETTRRLNLTNEGGCGRAICLLKNIMGLWLIQESRRQWTREGTTYSYADLERQALGAEPFRSFIDPDDPLFEPPGDLPRRVREYCRKTGQPVPDSVGAVMRCIYESLALTYRYTCGQIGEATGKTYEGIHVIGGGVKDGLLCQMTADFCALPVTAGPIEATAMGNSLVQFLALGVFDSVAQAREAVARSTQVQRYEPRPMDGVDAAYERFCRFIKP